jgi:peptide/nickel transport system substrate-binding protein
MKRTRLLALLAVLAMVVAACGGGEGETTTTGDGGAGTTTTVASTEPTEPPAGGNAGEGGNILLLQWQAPSQANAYLSTGTKDLLASSLVLEPLAEYDPDGLVVPALAAEIPSLENGGISEDQTQITWTLQEGLLWSDGTPVTSDDVVFSWEYCSNEATGCATAAYQGVASVEAVDDLTVTVTFRRTRSSRSLATPARSSSGPSSPTVSVRLRSPARIRTSSRWAPVPSW